MRIVGLAVVLALCGCTYHYTDYPTQPGVYYGASYDGGYVYGSNYGYGGNFGFPRVGVSVGLYNHGFFYDPFWYLGPGFGFGVSYIPSYWNLSFGFPAYYDYYYDYYYPRYGYAHYYSPFRFRYNGYWYRDHDRYYDRYWRRDSVRNEARNLAYGSRTTAPDRYRPSLNRPKDSARDAVRSRSYRPAVVDGRTRVVRPASSARPRSRATTSRSAEIRPAREEIRNVVRRERTQLPEARARAIAPARSVRVAPTRGDSSRGASPVARRPSSKPTPNTVSPAVVPQRQYSRPTTRSRSATRSRNTSSQSSSRSRPSSSRPSSSRKPASRSRGSGRARSGLGRSRGRR